MRPSVCSTRTESPTTGHCPPTWQPSAEHEPQYKAYQGRESERETCKFIAGWIGAVASYCNKERDHSAKEDADP